MQKSKYILITSLIILIGSFFYGRGHTEETAMTRNAGGTLLRSSANAPATLSQSRGQSGITTVFSSHNDVWSGRTRSTQNGEVIRYEFAKGNPQQVALSPEEIKNLREEKLQGYVEPEVEIALKDFLEDPRLPIVIEKCQDFLDVSNKQEKPEWAMFPQDFTLNAMLIIDAETGRKEINPILFSVINPQLSLAIGPDKDSSQNPWRQCLGTEYQDVIDLNNKFHTFSSYYMKGVPNVIQ